MENIPAFIAGVKAKKERLFGFGHRVYRNFDPRAKIIKEVRAQALCPCATLPRDAWLCACAWHIMVEM